MGLALRGAWVAGRGSGGGAFLLWGDPAPWTPTVSGSNGATEQNVRAALDQVARSAHLARTLADAGTWFPAVPLWRSESREPEVLGVVALPPLLALALLVRLPDPAVPGLVGPNGLWWRELARLAAAMLAGGRFLPGLLRDEDGDWATWEPAWTDPRAAAARARLGRDWPAEIARSAPGQDADAVVASFVRATVTAAVAQWRGDPALPGPPRAGAPPVQQAAYEWMLALLGPDPQVAGAPAALHVLARQLETWRDSRQPGLGTPSFRICFRLAPPTGPAVPWLLHFLLQATDDPSLLLPATHVWQMTGLAPTLHGRPFSRPPDRLRAGLEAAARLFPPLQETLRHSAPIHCPLPAAGAYRFLREAAPLLQSAGYGVLVPPWWDTPGSRPAVRLRVQPVAASEAASAVPTGSGILGADALVDFNWHVAIGDTVIARAEFERLVALKTPLVSVKGQWVEFRPREVEAAVRFWNAQAARGPRPVAAVARLLLGGDGAGDHAALPLAVDMATDAPPALAAALDGLREGLPGPDLPPPPGLTATLRPYQVRGYSWLVALRDLGLGACLADDMGLGKTVQTIALLLYARQAGPVLLVCPTSVVGNWVRELTRFAPALRVHVHQGAGRRTGAAFARTAAGHDVVLTSYSLLGRDEAVLRSVRWAGLILDEAQNIKNPDAGQTRAAKRLPAGYRIALTGTPVENRLDELWSILDFLNPGYLGSRETFRTTFAVPIEREGDSAARAALRARTGPLILRRLKTDRSIITDLPEKQEMKVYCSLTTEQATLYEAAVRDGLLQLAQRTGIARRGLVLSLLLRLKQITDHPALFLGDGSAPAGRSGKLARLTEMLEEVLAAGDKALIFTQFATMGHLLQAHLAEATGQVPIYLYGGTPRAERDAMVSAFAAPDGPRLFVLSIKAGGVGLNLTAANHVFHYDRWWNPAVENQATDRAFRIGQRKQVQVHKLIAAGTLDERIDALIESKRALAEGIVGSGEEWIGDLDDAALGALIALDREAEVGDE